jgi:hypothetical protein
LPQRVKATEHDLIFIHSGGAAAPLERPASGSHCVRPEITASQKSAPLD